MATLVSMAVSAGAAWAHGVVKTSGTINGVFLTGSSKKTGKGAEITVCAYFNAATGAFLGETETPDVSFADEPALFDFCAAAAPIVQ